MKLFKLIIIASLFTSCASPAKMFNSGLKKINKAIERDSTLKLPNDTTIIIDRVVQIDTVDNIITKTITNTITETVNECNYDAIKVRSARELRFAKSTLRDSIKHIERMYKFETKRIEDSLGYLVKENKELTKQIKSNNSQQKVADRNKTKQERGGWFTRMFGQLWWLLLAIGFMLGIYISNLLPKVPNIFKRK